MKNIVLTQELLYEYGQYLYDEEKSEITIEKYLRDIRKLYKFVGEQTLTKEQIIRYKQYLIQEGYMACSINSMLVAVNGFLQYLGLGEYKVKTLKRQRQIYCKDEKELTKAEYMRLLSVAKTQKQLSLILKTICGTGIRISELKYFTAEAVKHGEISVRCKNKTRIILIPTKLRKLLIDYARKNGIISGVIFRTKSGKPVDRSNIWKRMKKLCEEANVNPTKVFPHNLRKLFARTFYGIEKDIAKLADILGHSSIETTRIYIMTTGAEHREKIERLGLVI